VPVRDLIDFSDNSLEDRESVLRIEFAVLRIRVPRASSVVIQFLWRFGADIASGNINQDRSFLDFDALRAVGRDDLLKFRDSMLGVITPHLVKQFAWIHYAASQVDGGRFNLFGFSFGQFVPEDFDKRSFALPCSTANEFCLLGLAAPPEVTQSAPFLSPPDVEWTRFGID